MIFPSHLQDISIKLPAKCRKTSLFSHKKGLFEDFWPPSQHLAESTLVARECSCTAAERKNSGHPLFGNICRVSDARFCSLICPEVCFVWVPPATMPSSCISHNFRACLDVLRYYSCRGDQTSQGNHVRSETPANRAENNDRNPDCPPLTDSPLCSLFRTMIFSLHYSWRWIMYSCILQVLSPVSAGPLHCP